MGPIVLYTHAKNWEYPQSRFGEKAKKRHTDGGTDRDQFIGPTSIVGGSKNLKGIEMGQVK